MVVESVDGSTVRIAITVLAIVLKIPLQTWKQMKMSHCFCTVVTLLLHYCYTIVTLLLHYCYTIVTRTFDCSGRCHCSCVHSPYTALDLIGTVIVTLLLH
jgi:hypothetical protein